MEDPHAGPGMVFPAPTVADFRAAVLRAARGDEAVWALVCRKARDLPWAETEDDVRQRLVQAAKGYGGPVSVAAVSFEVRLNAHRNLSALSPTRTP